MQLLEAKYEDEKRRCLTELESVRKVCNQLLLLPSPLEIEGCCIALQRAADKEAAIQKAATKQIDSLTMQLEQLQEQLQKRIKEIADLGKNSQSSTQVVTRRETRACVESKLGGESSDVTYSWPSGSLKDEPMSDE